ncbi:MAG: thymidylate kinase [Patescibacteria group bacterium]|nr:MAG: thymidylate kinase [Patescibacteria group bacterium]
MLIAFEGGEGSGKGTQICLLQEVLESKGLKVLSIIEPGGTEVGKAIRNILLDRKDLDLLGITEAFLFSASRAQQVRTVTRPALEEGKIVLSDRSFYSTYAYQGYGRKQPISILKKMTELAVGETKPDLVFLLDLPPEIGLARKKSQNQINRLDAEAMEFHQRVRAGYLTLAKKDAKKWRVIDAAKPPEQIHSEILFALEPVLFPN